MNHLLTALFALGVACVTGLGYAQTPAASAQTPAVSAPAPAASAQASAASAAPAGAKSLQAKVAMCIGCHGIKGYQASFPEVYRVPMISGQSAKYIASALNAYKKGERRHPTMRGIADSLSDQDINDIAAYYASSGAEGAQPVPDKLTREPDAQVAELMKKAACTSCHGLNLSKPIDVYPKIAGQHSDYLFAAMRAYKTDNNPTMGRSNPVMGAIAKQFSNAELKALARYVSSLDGELKTVPENKFR